MAWPRPIPWPAPVTMATLPSSIPMGALPPRSHVSDGPSDRSGNAGSPRLEPIWVVQRPTRYFRDLIGGLLAVLRPKLVLLDLAGGIAGHDLDDLEPLGDGLHTESPTLEVVLNADERQRLLTVGYGDHRAHQLAALFVGQTDHRDV